MFEADVRGRAEIGRADTAARPVPQHERSPRTLYRMKVNAGWPVRSREFKYVVGFGQMRPLLRAGVIRLSIWRVASFQPFNLTLILRARESKLILRSFTFRQSLVRGE